MHGTRRKSCAFPSASSPEPAISPRSLMSCAHWRWREAPSGIKVFRSRIVPFSQRKALVVLSNVMKNS